MSSSTGALRPAADEAARHRERAFGDLAVKLADREALALDVAHHARRDQFGRRVDHATEDLLCRHAGCNAPLRIDALDRHSGELPAVAVEVPERDAVLHRHDHGLRPDQVRQFVDDSLDLVCLHRQHDDVLHAGFGVVIGREHVARDLRAAVVGDQLDAVAADGIEIRPAHDEGQLFAGQCELCAHVAADGAGADDCDFHAPPPQMPTSPQRASAQPKRGTALGGQAASARRLRCLAASTASVRKSAS